MYVITHDNKNAPQGVQDMDISPTDDDQSPGDVQAMNTNQIVLPEGSQQPTAAAFLGEATTVQDPEQPTRQQGGRGKCHNIPTWAAYNSLLSSENI